MTKITEKNKKNGFDETIFVTGKVEIPFIKDENGNPKTSKGVYIKWNGKKTVIVQYDNEYCLPEQINDHETIHDRYYTPLVQKVKNIIMNSMTVTEKKQVIEKLAKDYNGIIKGNEEAIIQEFVANVLSNMDYTYLGVFEELQRAYWKGDEQFIDNYKVSEYAESIDAGGVNADILDNIGFGDEFRLSETLGNIPHNEYMQLREYIVKKNNQDNALLPSDCKEIGNHLYIWRNVGKMDFIVVDSISITNDYDANAIRSDIKNGTIKRTKSVSEWSANIRSGRRSSTLLGGGVEGTSPNGSDDRLSVRQSESDTLGHLGEGSRIEKEHLKSVDRNGDENNIILYSTSIDNDIEEVLKEMDAEFEGDKVERLKPKLKEVFGERAEWIVHNMTRVFPNIPERGEKGTFFAEFRKNMVQWKVLPQVSMFKTQDKLNEMTKELNSAEYETFSKLVYYLDLQEEAQTQKDKGYTEILLPHERTLEEVNAKIDELNEKATDNVKNALTKRQEMWDNLKEQYISLNAHIGFDVSDKFTRKNYYHHQVIEYMNQSGKGVAKGKDIELKANRGWLKERHGSTLAINTDFLGVEYEAMLQMQYDIFVAHTLGKIKEQYDIKPQLENQAFANNKKLLNDIIKKESTDENGEAMVDSNGKPDSETYRQQLDFNRQIMRGFNGLFALAEEGVLPTFDGQFDSVVEALSNHNLKAPQLYNYVSSLASMELSETATEEELQAQISARTVLKYTSQKKAWVKEVLGNNYQTWETLAKSMRDTHSIHQPRRGNYFYTKDVVNEDAFAQAHNELIFALTSGESGMGIPAEAKKMFEQYSETIRLLGAAYEQWVIPNEIVKTMQEVANPKQANAIQKIVRSVMSAWKSVQTTFKDFFGFKYGLRNLGGDVTAVFELQPQILIKSKQAIKELYQAMLHNKYSDSLNEFIERGGYTAMQWANEMDKEMQDKLFAHLMSNKQTGKKALEIPKNLVKGYKNGVETAHNFRESILRYSAYLYYKEKINRNGGVVKDFVSSNRYIIRGLKTNEDKAYQLSKDLLGAYDEIGKMGQWLRQFVMPFYSFTEVNLKRYGRAVENLFANKYDNGEVIAQTVWRLLAPAFVLLLMHLWNRTFMKEDDDKLPPTARNVPHITLGHDNNGNVIAFTRIGSMSEILEWVGLEDGKWESAAEPFKEMTNKAVSMLNPTFKLAVELPMGISLYPDIFKPSPIRDRVEHFANSWGVAQYYNEFAGKPTKGLGNIIKSAFIYSYDIEESAYNEIISLKYDYQKKSDGTIHMPDKKSNALYYMKKAVKYKDKETALKYLDEYFENGGTPKGIAQSISMLNPMYGFTGKDTKEKGDEFIATLTPEQKEKMTIAQGYYENDLALPENVLANLRRENITEQQAKNLLTNYINAKCK